MAAKRIRSCSSRSDGPSVLDYVYPADLEGRRGELIRTDGQLAEGTEA